MSDVKPCNECPYRRVSAPGWLGESSYDPEEFLKQLNLHFGHPCHKAVDWDGTDDHADDLDMAVMNAPPCIGMIQFCKNTAKMFDYPVLEKARKLMPVDTENVFANRQEFIDHHKRK